MKPGPVRRTRSSRARRCSCSVRCSRSCSSYGLPRRQPARRARSEGLVGKFITGLFIARIPILLFQAVQALLPKLAPRRRRTSCRLPYRHAQAGLIVVGLGAIGVVAGATIGPLASEILFGKDKFVLGNRDLALLAAGAPGSSSLDALRRPQSPRWICAAAISWLAGIVAFVLVTAAGNDLFLRVEVGFVAGAGVAAVAVASARRTRPARRARRRG